MSPALLDHDLALAAAYAVWLYAIAWCVAAGLQRLAPVAAARSQASGRHGCLDGLRGVLAIGVLVHHSSAAHGQFTTGVWQWGQSPLLNQLGQSTVAMFFMITGFLFALKTREAPLDWRHLYRNRLARLFPPYAVVVVAVFVVSLAQSDWTLREPVGRLVREFLAWLTFSRPDINGQAMSWKLIAGVNWSLRYEAMFYLAGVPALYAAARWCRPPWRLGLALLLLAATLLRRGAHPATSGTSLYVAHFLAGIAVAYATELPALQRAMASRALRLLAAAGVVWLVTTRVHSNDAGSVLVTTLAFAAVVGGGSLFGLLRTRAAIWLGDISYGIYLIHGLTLWLGWTALSDWMLPASVELLPFALGMAGVAAFVTLLGTLSYLRMERPAMARWGHRRAAAPPR